MTNEPGRLFREAWIAGVGKHCPGEPKPAAPPRGTRPRSGNVRPPLSRGRIRDFVSVGGRNTERPTRERKGRRVAIRRIAQIHKRIDAPEPGYVAGWEALPAWQRETDADIFGAGGRQR